MRGGCGNSGVERTSPPSSCCVAVSTQQSLMCIGLEKVGAVRAFDCPKNAWRPRKKKLFQDIMRYRAGFQVVVLCLQSRFWIFSFNFLCISDRFTLFRFFLKCILFQSRNCYNNFLRQVYKQNVIDFRSVLLCFRSSIIFFWCKR